MTEWLTTGAMIDRLKVGEVAESDDGMRKASWNAYDNIVFNSTLNGGGINNLNRHTLKLKWRILPTYVSFEEAMKAFRERKTIQSHMPNGSIYNFHIDDALGCKSRWFYESVKEGKWTIEGDSE